MIITILSNILNLPMAELQNIKTYEKKQMKTQKKLYNYA